MFFNLSHSLNNTQSCLLRGKLLAMQLYPDTVAWILDYLIGWPQYVKDWMQHQRKTMKDKIKTILGNPSQPLYDELWQMGQLTQPLVHFTPLQTLACISCHQTAQQ